MIRMSRLIGCLVTGGVVAIAAWAIALEWPVAISFGVLTAAVLFVSSLRPNASIELWPPQQKPAASSTSEISRLALAIHDTRNEAAPMAARRVAELLRGAAAARGIDIDDPTSDFAERTIGTGLWQRLRDGQRVSLDELNAALTRAEDLINLERNV